MVYQQFGDMALRGIGWTTLIAFGIAIAVVSLIAIYIYFSLAWMKIAERLKYKYPWFAWIPVLNIAMMLQLGGFNWAWTLLILIPIFGWIALFILVIIATWRIFERCDYPGWFSLSMIIPEIGWILYLIAIGFVAWSERGVKVIVKRKAPRKRR